MLSWMRGKFGPILVTSIIGFIAFVFIFSGVFTPKATRGMHEGAVAGKVNGDSITIPEYNRELTRRMEFFKSMSGGQLSEAQIKMFRIRENVFQELVNRRLMAQEAEREGLIASEEEVREKIREIPAFQKDGKFDSITYKRVLQANNFTAAGFEKNLREDLVLQQFSRRFRNRVKVSDEEVKKEYLIQSDKRNIKYVLLTHETARKAIQVPPADIQKFLADGAKLNLAKSQFEARKERDYKGMTFDQAKEKLAHEILASEKVEEVRKINEGLATQVVAVLTADKGSDAKVNALLKPYGTEIKSTGLISRMNRFIPGVGEAPELLVDAFKSKSPIDPSEGGKAKRYNSAAWWLVAVVTGTEKPDLAKLESTREKVLQEIATRKERTVFDAWMKKVVDSAKIDKNDAVVGGEGG